MASENSGSAPKRRRKKGPPQLRVVFDTSVLYTGSASDLVREEIAKLISSNIHPDLEITWYLPEVVRHERQHQMQSEALKLSLHVAKVEKLLGHNLNITDETLKECVERTVTQHAAKCNLTPLGLNPEGVDWHRLISDAVYRRPPFKGGESEKGFRDAIILESLLQLIEASPKTPKICRVAFVSGDAELLDAVRSRLSDAPNVAVFETIEEIKGFINTLVSAVDEDFIALLKPKAQRLFFLPKNEGTLFYREKTGKALTQKFSVELNAIPSGATSRENGTWHIKAPNFVKKQGRRISWVSRIEIDCEAKKSVPQPTATQFPTVGGFGLALHGAGPAASPSRSASLVGGVEATKSLRDLLAVFSDAVAPMKDVVTHKGVDIYEVLWSAEVTAAKELRRPTIDEIRHAETNWESA